MLASTIYNKLATHNNTTNAFGENIVRSSSEPLHTNKQSVIPTASIGFLLDTSALKDAGRGKAKLIFCYRGRSSKSR